MPGIVSVDLFAGGGGASTGIRLATGRSPIVAVNHCRAAVDMHELNHPETAHFCESVYNVRPRTVIGGQRVDLLWLSPDCTHFSRAKGKAPRSRGIRGLAFMAVTWAAEVRPRVIILENVAEFLTWGPLHPDDHPDARLRGQPIRELAGVTFHEFLRTLQALGYVVDWRILNAADYGAPTARKRLFLVARCDGEPITWPAPTHGPGLALPWRTAAECIDWQIPAPSIFERKRPLAPATLRRIAAGVVRYVVCGRPFLVNLTHGGRLENLDRPLNTITTANRGEKALVAATLINTRNGERPTQDPRVRDIERPLGVITAQGSQGGLAAYHLSRFYGTATGAPVDAPLGMITAGGGRGGGHAGLVAAFLARNNGTTEGKFNAGRGLGSPTGTITSRDTHGLVCAGVQPDQRQAGHAADVAALLVKYYGEGGQLAKMGEPLHTIVTKARFGLVTVPILGEDYVIDDIGFRMLDPRELLRAQFSPEVAREIVMSGTKAEQIARIGNSVPPLVVEALVRAQFNLGERYQLAA